MNKLCVFALALLLSGCFDWSRVPAASLDPGRSVRVEEHGRTTQLHDVNVCRLETKAIVVAGTLETAQDDRDSSPCACMFPPCKSIDVTNANVYVKRLEVGATVTFIALAAAATTAVAIITAMFFLSAPVAEIAPR